MKKLAIGETIAYDAEVVGFQLIPQDFSRFVGRLVLMDDEAYGAEEPSWLEVVELKHVNYDGSLEIWDGEETQTIPKNKLVKHSGSYVAFYAISEVAEVQEVAETPAESQVIVSPEYQKAVTLTRHIIAEAQAMQQSLYEVCKGLKEMRDGKLYKELGYRNFEDYCKNEVGLTRQQGYTYLKIAENLPEDFVKSTLQIGVQKLALLAKLDETDREEVLQRVNPDETSTKQLQAQIKQLQAEKAQLQAQQGETIRKLEEAETKYYESEDKYMRLSGDYDELKGENTNLFIANHGYIDKIDELQTQLEKKVTDATYVDGADRIDELERKIQELKESHQKELDQLNLNYQLKYEELKEESAGKVQLIENDDAIISVYVESALFAVQELKHQLKRRKQTPDNSPLMTTLQQFYGKLEAYKSTLK